MTTKLEELDSPSSFPTIESSMLPQRERASCAVCREEGDGFHFGAEACRACAAFFRRSVSLDKRYLCRGNNDCDIAANVRCMCRACRFTKCLEVGMNPAGVQQRRDVIGKREMKPDSTNMDLYQALSSIGESVLPTTSSPTPLVGDLPAELIDAMPILTKMRVNYRKMDNARIVIHRKDGQSLFKEKAPKAINYKECEEQSIREVSLVADWISWCFDEFVQLPIDQKKVLFRNFYTPFNMIEGAFLCHINDTSNAIICPSGDYIDIQNLDKFFYNPDVEQQQLSPDEVKKMFQPSFEIHRRALILPVMAEKVDVYEFFALCTLLFWDFGLEEQTDECVLIGKEVKDRVMRELTFYLRFVKKIQEPAVRVAQLLTLLPAVQRSVRRFQEDIELSTVFNIYAPGKQFYDLVNGKFC